MSTYAPCTYFIQSRSLILKSLNHDEQPKITIETCRGNDHEANIVNDNL